MEKSGVGAKWVRSALTNIIRLIIIRITKPHWLLQNETVNELPNYNLALHL